MASSLSEVITNDMAGEQKLPCGTTKAEHVRQGNFIHKAHFRHGATQGASQG